MFCDEYLKLMIKQWSKKERFIKLHALKTGRGSLLGPGAEMASYALGHYASRELVANTLTMCSSSGPFYVFTGLD